ncbi:MAG: hypothetical protein IPJ13_26195 [Saprospiraceae bacterium]|nr:hypothetical protein [Saprospiraceae bacterium]
MELGGINDYKLKYSKFLEEKEKQKNDTKIAAFENQQKDIAQKEDHQSFYG